VTTSNMKSDSGTSLAGRKIIITGAASGIGHATAILFAAQGASIAMLDVKDIALWQEGPGNALRYQVDLLDRTRVQSEVQRAGEALGGINGVVNCAAIGIYGSIDDYPIEDWDRVLGVNLTAPFLLIQAAMPFLRRARAATIVNVASGAGLRPNAPGSLAYATSKGGLISMSKVLAYELAPAIRVNTVTPGVVDTAMSRNVVIGEYDDPNDAPFVQNYALKRVAEPRELANVILFLTSDASSFVTGSNLIADGGRLFL